MGVLSDPRTNAALCEKAEAAVSPKHQGGGTTVGTAGANNGSSKLHNLCRRLFGSVASWHVLSAMKFLDLGNMRVRDLGSLSFPRIFLQLRELVLDGNPHLTEARFSLAKHGGGKLPHVTILRLSGCPKVFQTYGKASQTSSLYPGGHASRNVQQTAAQIAKKLKLQQTQRKKAWSHFSC
jgi:hypothetical protein